MEKGVARSHYGPERIDAYFGAVFSNLMSVSMIIATAATLYVVGQREIGSAGTQLARSSRWWGSAARILFGIGLLGATLLAGAVLPLATAYAVSEAFGMPKGVNLDFRRGRVFFSLFTALIVVGVVTRAYSEHSSDAVAGRSSSTERFALADHPRLHSLAYQRQTSDEGTEEYAA